MTENTPTGWEGILADGETILWQGRPDAKIEWFKLLSFESFFGLFFAGFATFWIAGAAAMTGAARGAGGIDGVFSFFPLFGLPFLAIGLYMVFGRLIWDAYSRRYTWYTLTDRGAYIASNVLGRRSLKTYPYTDMKTPDLIDDIPGSVIFAEDLVVNVHRSRSRNGFSGRSRTSTRRVPIGFMRIEDARSVYRMIADRRRSANSDGGGPSS